MKRSQMLLVYFLSSISMACPIILSAGYSPQTHFSSDECHQDEDCGDDERPWYYHNYHHLSHHDALIESDPTYELEDDTMYPGQREDFSDMLFRE